MSRSNKAKCDFCGAPLESKRKNAKHCAACNAALRRAEGIVQYRVRTGTLSKDGYRAAVEAEVRKDVEERRRRSEKSNRPRCPYCGNVGNLDMSGYCATCRKTRRDSIHMVTGRTNGWDRPPKAKAEVVGGWRGRPVAGPSIRGTRTGILEGL